MLAASLNAFFCASPIYGSAEDFASLLDVTVSRDVTPAAKQQIGETRKKLLAQRPAFFRFDNSSGIIKGEQPLIRASRASKVAGTFLVLFWCAKENLAQRKSSLARATSARSISKTISGSLLARKREPYSAFFKNSGSSFSISASAFPRWLMASFSSGVSWA